MTHKLISVVGLKGGVGKSTLVSCLAIYYMQEYNLPVNILDLDPMNITQFQTFYDLNANDLNLRRDVSTEFSVVNEIKLKDQYINIADFPCNQGINEHIKFILNNSSVIIFPSTYEPADLHVLKNNTLASFSSFNPKFVFFTKTSKNLIEVDNEIICEKIFDQGFPYRKKFFNGIINNLDMGLIDINMKLRNIPDFKDLVKTINPYILLK